MKITYEHLRDLPDFSDGTYHEGTRGEYFRAVCPFHEDNEPSLLVYPIDWTPSGSHDGYWRCLAGCGMGGLDMLWRQRELKGKKSLAKRKAPFALEWHPPALPTDKEGLNAKADVACAILNKWPQLGWYLEQRGLKDRIEVRNLGYMDGWITVPVYSALGDIETLILRATPPIQEANGVRFHSPALPPKLYVPNWKLTMASDTVYIVFGMFDALSLDEVGLPVCCSTHGNQSLNPMWFSRFYGKKLLLVSDGVPHERAEALERCRMLYQAGLSAYMHDIAYPNGCKDVNDILKNFGSDELRKRMIGVIA